METFSALLAFCAGNTHKGQWRGALTFSLICVWRSGWVNKRRWFETSLRSLLRHCYAICIQLTDLPVSPWKQACGSRLLRPLQTWMALATHCVASILPWRRLVRSSISSVRGTWTDNMCTSTSRPRPSYRFVKWKCMDNVSIDRLLNSLSLVAIGP